MKKNYVSLTLLVALTISMGMWSCKSAKAPTQSVQQILPKLPSPSAKPNTNRTKSSSERKTMVIAPI